jgi:NAD(P)-dependent dehydrogenase (short-subunit alcohol dehydrogenase family)
LAGKKALITGGDSGIGGAIAILYALEDADSAILYTPQERRAQKIQKHWLKRKKRPAI